VMKTAFTRSSCYIPMILGSFSSCVTVIRDQIDGS
jgi:hypothetical protein